MKNTKLASLSMICVAGGAFSSIAGQHPEIQHLNLSNDDIALKQSDVVNKISKSTDLSGTKFARSQSLTGLIGSTTDSSNGASSVSDDCYSNCYAEPAVFDPCISSGYTQTTTCSTGYLQETCPTNSAYWKCSTPAAICIASGFDTTTTCSTGYTTDTCLQDNAYWKCTCHSDNCATFLTNADNARASFVTLVSTTATSSAYSQAFATTSGVYTSTATLNFSSDADKTNAINAYTNYASTAGAYSANCTAYSNTLSCYSNCHTETVDCPSYLASQSVSTATTAAELTTALSSSNSTIALLADVSTTSINLGAKKLVGPKYFTSSSACTALSTPTLTLSGEPAISMDNETTTGLQYLNVTVSGNPISVGTVSGTLSNVSISYSADQGLVTEGDVTISGATTISNSATSFPAFTISSSDVVEVNDNLTLTGNLDADGTLNVASGKTLTITKGNMWVAGSTSIDGKLVLSNSSYGVEVGSGGGLVLNGSGSSITSTNYAFFLSADGSGVDIGGTTTVTGSKLFYITANALASIAATVTYNGSTVPTGPYNSSY